MMVMMRKMIDDHGDDGDRDDDDKLLNLYI